MDLTGFELWPAGPAGDVRSFAVVADGPELGGGCSVATGVGALPGWLVAAILMRRRRRTRRPHALAVSSSSRPFVSGRVENTNPIATRLKIAVDAITGPNASVSRTMKPTAIGEST